MRKLNKLGKAVVNTVVGMTAGTIVLLNVVTANGVENTETVDIVWGTEVGTVQEAIVHVNGDVSRNELQDAYVAFRELNNINTWESLADIKAGTYNIPVLD